MKMKPKTIIWPVLLLFFSFLMVSVVGLECELAYVGRGLCDNNDNILFRLSSDASSHAGLWNQNAYPYGVCCHEAYPFTRNCEQNDRNLIVRLSSHISAHGQTAAYGTYPQDVCYSGLDCEYVNDDNCDNLGEYYECLASMSSGNAAHFGACSGDGAYP